VIDPHDTNCRYHHGRYDENKQQDDAKEELHVVVNSG
jgi:hypothetical protein